MNHIYWTNNNDIYYLHNNNGYIEIQKSLPHIFGVLVISQI